ncbi:MAG: hypothetical protein II978_07160 [Clostridia bacterium]|nr:hypothetical protein [Clostridia bacterium]
MRIKLARAICIALAIVSVAAGISYQVLSANKKSEKLNAVFVISHIDK